MTSTYTRSSISPPSTSQVKQRKSKLSHAISTPNLAETEPIILSDDEDDGQTFVQTQNVLPLRQNDYASQSSTSSSNVAAPVTSNVRAQKIQPILQDGDDEDEEWLA